MFKNLNLTKDIKNIHFRGIGGVSMSGVAATLKSLGYYVTGSDDNESIHTKALQKNGIQVVIGKDFVNLKKADLLIYTNSMPENDEELELARSINIPIMERAEALGLIAKEYQHSIAIAGTNGKTTTTAMISTIFLEAKKDPSIQIGAWLKNINANYRIGNSEILILEACEYKESFLQFEHETAIILNIDYDHLDYFKNFENIKATFYKFAQNTKNNGNIILNYDDINSLNFKEQLLNEGKEFNIYTFGLNEEADVFAKNIEYSNNVFKYQLFFKNEFLVEIELNVFGNFNVLNSLAAASVALAYNINPLDIRNGLKNFYGADRRFELRGQINGANVYDDYAHNPTKVKELYTAAKVLGKEVWIVFEPHTYSRTKGLFNEFVESLREYDKIILTKIYAAREQNIFDIKSEDIVNDLNEKYNKEAIYIDTYEDIIKYLKENTDSNDLILFVGAGTINQLFDYV